MTLPAVTSGSIPPWQIEAELHALTFPHRHQHCHMRLGNAEWLWDFHKMQRAQFRECMQQTHMRHSMDDSEAKLNINQKF
jgi:hypothetical protein